MTHRAAFVQPIIAQRIYDLVFVNVLCQNAFGFFILHSLLCRRLIRDMEQTARIYTFFFQKGRQLR